MLIVTIKYRFYFILTHYVKLPPGGYTLNYHPSRAGQWQNQDHLFLILFPIRVDSLPLGYASTNLVFPVASKALKQWGFWVNLKSPAFIISLKLSVHLDMLAILWLMLLHSHGVLTAMISAAFLWSAKRTDFLWCKYCSVEWYTLPLLSFNFADWFKLERWDSVP